MKIFLFNFNDFTISESVLGSAPRRTKKMGTEIIWFGVSERGFKLKTTLHRGLKVNG